MQPLYDQIGKQYDTTRKADPEIIRRLHVHLQLEQGNVLDIACGTGNYTLALQQLGLNMTGVDISSEMIQQAKGKSATVRWDQADVQALPYAKGTFDGATCILSVHHFPQLLKPFQEVYRVLKRGRFALFTSTPEQIKKYWLNEYFLQALLDSRLKEDIATGRISEVLTQYKSDLGDYAFVVAEKRTEATG